jgi:hypothetical protein
MPAHTESVLDAAHVNGFNGVDIILFIAPAFTHPRVTIATCVDGMPGSLISYSPSMKRRCWNA